VELGIREKVGNKKYAIGVKGESREARTKGRVQSNCVSHYWKVLEKATKRREGKGGH